MPVAKPIPDHAPDPRAVLAALWRDAGFDDAALDDVELIGAEPVLPSSFAVGTAAQATIAAAALAAAEVWRLRTGRRQRVSVDMRRAAIEFRSEHYVSVDGHAPEKLWDDISGLYRCGDGRWVRLHCVLPHHRAGLIKLLRCAEDRASVQRALDKWQAEAIETAAAQAGLVVSASRSLAEWDRHPQGRAVAALPLFSIEKIGDAPKLELGCRRTSAGRSARARSHPHYRRSGLRPHFGGSRRRRAAGYGRAFAVDPVARHRYRPRQIVGGHRLARGKWTRKAHRDAARRRYSCSRLSARRHCRPRLFSAATQPASGLASFMSRSAPMVRRDHGPIAAASIRWCRTRAA